MKQRKQRKDFSQTALATVEKVIGGKLVEKAKRAKGENEKSKKKPARRGA